MDSGDIVSKSKKIRIYPKSEQKELFKKWIGVQRYIYNKTVEYLKSDEKPEHWMVFAKGLLSELPDWGKEVPYQIKKIAVRDAYQAYWTNCRKVKKGLLKSFSLSFKSKRDLYQSCFIPKSAIKEVGIYPSISGKMYYSEDIPEEVLDGRLVCDRGRWYVCIPTRIKTMKSESQGRIVAVDPGIRTFATFFGGNCFGQIGRHDFGRIVRLCHYLDDLLSRSAKECCKKRRAMRRAASRIRCKIQDLVDELHHKTARFLVDNFDVILFPKFESKSMVCKAGRKIRKKTVRSMLSYAFYRFRAFLKHKCVEAGKRFVEVSEAYTSRWDGFSCKLLPKFSSEVFKVGNSRVNRDINGARNILCFALADTPYVRDSIANVSES